MYFCGEIPDAQYKINLVFHNGHYNVITSLTSAFACTYFCEAWHVPYSNKDGHTCSNTCYACKTVSPPCKLEQGACFALNATDISKMKTVLQNIKGTFVKQ